MPRHLICFKNWTTPMVNEIIYSAINLKCKLCDSHNVKLNLLHGSKIMIMQEVNEPILQVAVSKAATMLGARDVNVVDRVMWDHDYNGRIFSLMTDAIFMTSSTHWCVQRFANMSLVPVMCMKSRTHASIQALATIMAIIEQFGTMNNVNVSYLGPPHPVLNSYLLLCPMLSANIRFKCCCEDICTNVSPQCWIFFHTCPQGEEVPDELIHCCNTRTFNAFQNMHYIVAALMANAIKGHKFEMDHELR